MIERLGKRWFLVPQRGQRLTEQSWNCIDETKLDQLSYQAPNGYQSQSGFTNSAGRTVLLQVQKYSEF